MTPARLEILESIADGSANTAAALAEWLGRPLPTIKNALTYLRRSGFLVVTATGRNHMGSPIYVYAVTGLAFAYFPGLNPETAAERIASALEDARARVAELESALASLREAA